VKFLNTLYPNMRVMDEKGDTLVQFADGALNTEDPAVIERLAGFDFVTTEGGDKPALAAKKRAAKKSAAAPAE